MCRFQKAESAGSNPALPTKKVNVHMTPEESAEHIYQWLLQCPKQRCLLLDIVFEFNIYGNSPSKVNTALGLALLCERKIIEQDDDSVPVGKRKVWIIG